MLLHVGAWTFCPQSLLSMELPLVAAAPGEGSRTRSIYTSMGDHYLHTGKFPYITIKFKTDFGQIIYDFKFSPKHRAGSAIGI